MESSRKRKKKERERRRNEKQNRIMGSRREAEEKREMKIAERELCGKNVGGGKSKK